jgi:hypothetical protein
MQMDGPDPHAAERSQSRERMWAWVRIFLGLMQMMGAVASVYFLISTGMSTLSLAATVLTGLLLILSKFLFRA